MNIVITGGSRGLGKAIAEKFASDKQGHTILLCARNAESLESAAIDLQSRFPRTTIKWLVCDMSVKENVIQFGSWVLEQVDKVDVLVNNTGIFIPGSVHNEPDGALEEMIAANLYSAYHLTRCIVPSMMQLKSGHIFNMCSIASLKAYHNGGAYSISKYALAGFSHNLREEMKHYGVKVTGIYPGAVYTRSWEGSGVDPHRIMTEKDIADMVYASTFLSPQACVEDIIIRPQLGDL